ncbi:hypothetical protein BJX70DRAFT_355658 [Aspergillus crustosus]
MPTQTILGHSFFSQDDVQLASLIPNIRDIDLDALDTVLPLQSRDFTIKNVDNPTGQFEAQTDSTFQAFLAQIARWTLKQSKQVNLSLRAQKGRVYTLRQPTR